MVPKHSAEVLCHVPKPKKAVIYLTEKMHVLDKLPSGLSLHIVLWAVEFNVSESAM